MKLARKLTLAVIAGILTIMAVAAAVRVQRETALFEADMSRDHRFIGRSMRDAVAWIAESDGLQRAEDMLRTGNLRGPRTQIRVVELARDAQTAARPSDPRAPVESIARGDEYQAPYQHRFYTYIPLLLDGQPPRALEVSESLDDEVRYIRSSVLNNALALCGIVFVCSILAIALGYVFVGRPMSKLTDKARRVGAGDLSGPLHFKQHDEIAEFAVEMNAMCDRLAEAHGKLEEETAQKIAALEQLRHADRLRTVGQLASGLAHELGTPLNVVLGRSRMILAGDSTPEESADNARIIVDQATRMTALIRQLLDFARPRGPNLQNVDLRGIARQTVEMLSTLADKRRVTLTLECGDAELRADVDPTQVQQALTNLVVNAIQAMTEPGTVVLRLGVRRAKPPVDHGGEPADYRFITVEDHGAGIPKENLSRIFEPFFTTKGVGEGTGLGLPVTYGIVRDHNGWIDVQSDPGKGSSFTIYVPERRRDRESSAPAGRPRPSSPPMLDRSAHATAAALQR